MSDRKKTTEALPGDLVQIIAPGHDYRGAFAMVTGCHRWGFSAFIPPIPSPSGSTAAGVYVRLKPERKSSPSDFVIVGAAFLMPPEVVKARQQVIETRKATA